MLAEIATIVDDNLEASLLRSYERRVQRVQLSESRKAAGESGAGALDDFFEDYQSLATINAAMKLWASQAKSKGLPNVVFNTCGHTLCTQLPFGARSDAIPYTHLHSYSMHRF